MCALTFTRAGWLCLVLISWVIGVDGARADAQASPFNQDASAVRPTINTAVLPATTGNACRSAAAASCPAESVSTLMLNALPVRLPAARLGKDYAQAIQARGGRLSYQFKLASGDLPPGLMLKADGRLQGQAGKAGEYRFSVVVRDQSGQEAQQDYQLAVIVPSAGKTVASSPAATLDALALTDAQKKLATKTQIDVYRLTQKIVDGIALAEPEPEADPDELDIAVPTPQPEGPVLPESFNDATLAQLKQLLAPLVDVEYPNRQLFEAALDNQVCQYAVELVRQSALAKKQEISPEAARKKVCPARQPKKNTSTQATAELVPLNQLPSTLLPDVLRVQLIEQSRLDPGPDLLGGGAPLWRSSGCNCLVKSGKGDVYAIYPNWHDPAKAAKIDFGVYDRISLFAMPFDEYGNVTQLDLNNDRQQAFLRAIHTFGSKLDLVLYRNDWQFLRNLTEDRQNWAIQQTVTQAVNQINQPMPGWDAKWHSWLPGPDYGRIERIADGLTLYLANPPREDKALQADFLRYRDRLIVELISALKRSPYPHVLNLVMYDTDLVFEGQAQSNEDGPGWRLEKLFDYLVQAEEPQIRDGRIVVENGGGKSRTNLTLRFMVFLTEPTVDSKKRLRSFIESSRRVSGSSQLIFLRKLYPLISVGGSKELQFADDMSYFVDNFGGVVLWPQPEENPKVSQSVEDGLRATFLVDEPRESRVCTLVCEWHWPLRALFFALLLLMLLSFLLYILCSRIRELGRPYLLYLLLSCVPPLVIGAGLLQCDPGLEVLRQNNTLLYGLLGGLLLLALIPLLKPRVEKP